MDVTYIVIIIAVILVSMTLHEAMHAFMSYWLGDDTARREGRLTLNPIKHIDPFLTILLPVMLAIVGAPIFGGAKPVPFNPHSLRWGEWGVALVAVAGPLTNLFIAFIAFGVGVLTGVIAIEGVLATLYGQIVFAFITVNLGFFIFNILPIPPLDGSRVLYALAPDFIRRGMEAIERFGIIVVFAIVLIAGGALGMFMGQSIQFIYDVFLSIFRLG
jgi:Zn-dependent protease